MKNYANPPHEKNLKIYKLSLLNIFKSNKSVYNNKYYL